jgi:hypothetical protein
MDGTTAAPDLIRYAALYIDVPNVLTHGQEKGKRRHHLTDINWSDLVSSMLSTLGARNAQYTGSVYLYRRELSELSRGEQELRAALGPHAAALSVIGSTQDIDARLISAMWADVMRIYLELDGKNPDVCHEITVLLASGDHIYADAITKMRSVLGRRVNLRLHAFAHRESLSRDLRRICDETYFLDYQSLP